jgi:hypothetical protein
MKTILDAPNLYQDAADNSHSPSRDGWRRIFARVGCISGWRFRWLCLSLVVNCTIDPP